MAEELVKVASGYKPPWNNLLLESPHSIREHLIAEHQFLATHVALLSDTECREAHDRCHEAQLGGTLILR